MEAFWTTEYGQNLLSVEQTEIDRLLSSPNTTTLEDLFDEDELLQQCSNKNTQLINFLSKQENINKLVSYITRPWQQHMTQILNHLKEKEKENEQNNNNNNNNNNAPSSPLSKNGVTRVSSIQEEPNIIQLSDPINDSNDTKDNDITSLAQEIANNDNQNEESNMDSKDKNDILTQIINDNIPNENNDNNEDNTTNDDNKDNNIEIKQQNDNDDNDDEFNDTNYDNLQLSDDENNDDNDDENDNNIKTDIISPSNESNDESNDESKPPTLKKKGSIVDMLMDGPQFVDDTELNATNDNDNDNDKEEAKIDENMDNDEHNDADPELPDLDVKKETDTDVVVDDNRDILDNNSESKPLIYDSNKDDIPPPPPPAPHKPSKLEEFESEIGIEKVKLKYPYLASEIINCQIPQILDTILNENNPFLDMLFDFIVQQPPLNAVLTNYWRSCIVGLVRRNSIVILKYIKARKNLLSSLVQHIRDQSIMELVIALGWDPAIEELKELDEVADWMYNESLVPKLIETLSPFHTPDEHSATSYTLVDIVAKTSRSTNLVLFYNLASEQQIDALLESLSVLLALLHHYPNVSAEKQQFGDGDDHNNQIPPPPTTTNTTTIKIIGATNVNPYKIKYQTPLTHKSNTTKSSNNYSPITATNTLDSGTSSSMTPAPKNLKSPIIKSPNTKKSPIGYYQYHQQTLQPTTTPI